MPSLDAFWRDVESADAVTAHNVARFDVPLLNAHRFREGQSLAEWPLVIDTMKLVFEDDVSFRDMSRSQASLGSMLKLNESKMTVHIPTWEAAAAGARWALSVVEERCVSDVMQHKALYKKLYGWKER